MYLVRCKLSGVRVNCTSGSNDEIKELRETGDWDIFLGPPERARAETGGADQWVLKRRECSGFGVIK